jgi:signal transduction histidine kinase
MATESASVLNLSKPTLSQLEQHAEAIDSELDQLAHYSLRSGVGAIGYRSDAYLEAEHTVWIEIQLEAPTAIDQIVLVPSIWRDNKAGFEADGFPLEFEVIAGTEEDSEGTVLASFDAHSKILPRIAPLLIPCETVASWVRVEASVLSPRQFDGKYNLELSEIMIFNGATNVALHRPVTTSSSITKIRGARKKAYLVDGFTPFLMDAGRGEGTVAFLGITSVDSQPSITIDLEDSYPLDRIQLHAIDFNDTIPQATPAGYGLPERLHIEGAQEADFSDARTLTEYHRKSIYDVGPILAQGFPVTECRYVRITALEPYVFEEDNQEQDQARMGFAEVEIFSGDNNVADGKTATTHQLYGKGRSLSTLTDGNNLYGQILPIRQWLEELARRHDLENERPIVASELNRRYAHQKTMLQNFIWLTVLLVVGIGFIILIERTRRIRQISRIKERFAADLHDELGANLHTIGLLSDLSKELIHSPDKLSKLLDRIRIFTQRSGTAARYCTNMLEAKGICEDLVDEMNRSSRRLLSDLDYDIEFSGEALLEDLKPRVRIDIFLFFKECLINVLRHSGATKVSIRLVATPKDICLTITDNGHGIGTGKDQVPASSRRRARLLRARVTAEHPKQGGTRISLTVKPRKFRIL